MRAETIAGGENRFDAPAAPRIAPLSAVRNERVAPAPITARRLIGITIDEKAMKHGMMQAANFMLEQKYPTIIHGIDDFFEAKLMIAHLLRYQAAILEKRVGTGKVRDIDGDVVPIVGTARLLGFAEDQRLIAADLDPALVRLMAFALATYPHVLPQITRMTTGLAPNDARFQARWSDFLHALGRALQPTSA